MISFGKKTKKKAQSTAGKEAAISLLTEQLAPNSSPRELLSKLSDRQPERLHWLGTSYGVTPSLYSFWKRAEYTPVYVRLTSNELTGEHTCIMLTTLSTEDCNQDWLPALHEDFKRRFIPLLGYDFQTFPTSLGLEVLNPCITGQEQPETIDMVTAEVVK